MNTLTLPAGTDEYVKVKVSARESGASVDVTAGTNEWQSAAAGSTSADLIEGSWVAGTWETVAAGNYLARALVVTTLGLSAPGSYDLWLRVAESPETPVRKVGRLVLT